MSIIKRIIYILENKGLKRADLARHLNKSTGQISMWESRNTNPPAEFIPDIADFLGVSTEYILTGAESTRTRYEHSLGAMNLAQTINSNLDSVIIPYSGNERKDTIAKEILKTDLTEDDLKLIEFILDKYKK